MPELQPRLPFVQAVFFIVGELVADRPESRGRIEHEVASARLHLRTRDSNGRSLLSQLDKVGIKPDAAGLPIRMDLHRLCRPLEG